MTVTPERNGRWSAALRWSPAAEPMDARAVVVAALAMTVPALAGLATGRLHTGLVIGLGAVLLAGESPTFDRGGEARPSPLSALPPAVLAVVVATLVAGRPWDDAVLISLAGCAALVSGYSRPLGVASIRFIVYLVLSATLLQGAGADVAQAALVFGLGALWNVAVRVALRRRASDAAGEPVAPPRMVTGAQRRAYFRRTLHSVAGWQFTLRVVAGLGVASLVRHAWPTHHFGWVVLTVALLTQRPLEHLPVKTVQRTLGALLGVLLTWAVRAVGLGAEPLAAVVCLLATGAYLARPRSYLAYAVLSTPVILLVLDLGRTADASLLADRLVATLAGAAIVAAASVALDLAVRRFDPPAPPAAARRRAPA